jgi:alpha-methylacyl-CoA racemase
MKPLDHIQVLTLALNLPGPLAAAQLRQLGARVVKIEPPAGDPLATAQPAWYRSLQVGQEILRLDLKDAQARRLLEERLTQTDLLMTSFRPAALARLGLLWPKLTARYPRLCQVAILGYPPPHEDRPGHDLTYQAQVGLVVPPHLPRTVLADLAGAQEVVQAALALLLARERGQGAQSVQVSLAEAARRLAEPLRYGVTSPGGILGGGLPGYNLYRAQDGWIALAALEPRFVDTLQSELDLSAFEYEELQRVFRTRTAHAWETWGSERDLPIVAVRDMPPVPESQS